MSVNNNAPTPPIDYAAEQQTQEQVQEQGQQIEQALQQIPINARSFTFNNQRPFTMGVKTPQLRRVPKKTRKSTPLTSEQIRRKIKGPLWSNASNNTPKKRFKLTFANNTKPGSQSNANTQPLNGGRYHRKHKTRRHRKHKTHRRR